VTAASAGLLTPVAAPTVRRGGRAARIGAGVAVLAVALLAYLPYLVSRGAQVSLVLLFTYVVLATMWNLLAGYGGMVSVGQQAFIGLGAYGLVYLADTVGVSPFVAVPLAALAAGVVAWLTSYLVFRLVGGYFAIGTWVVAEVFRLLTSEVDALGGGSGISLRAYAGLTPTYRIAYVYWMSLAAVVLAVAGTYALMRSRLGLALTAIRDDHTAADSLGVRVTRSRRIVYVVAAVGCGLAGGMIASNALRVDPTSVYGVDYAAFMIFMVIIGGIGTIEGPILGAVLFYLLERQFAELGAGYLIGLGAVAVFTVLFAPKGLWGLVSRGRVHLFPVGYRVVAPPAGGRMAP
jgi:branched-chain amino acid transport system permease protein